MTARYSGWVLLNYPVVTSRSRDNAGGYDHLIGNIQTYRHLGFKVLCICRWSPRLVDLLEGALVLNIVPGAAVPALSKEISANATMAKPRTPLLWRRLTLAARAGALTLLGVVLKLLPRPRLLHQRANKRFMYKNSDQVTIHLVELNDEFVPLDLCDGYLTVTPRPELSLPQLVSRWPVHGVSVIDKPLFLKRLAMLAKPSRRLNVMLFGVGGTTSTQMIRKFIEGHPWFREASFDLHIFGGYSASINSGGVVEHGWHDLKHVSAQDFDAAVLFYDEGIYDDERLRLGSPTKLWKYIDWSLPVFSNRQYISHQFLGRFDCSNKVLHDYELGCQYANYLERLRRETIPSVYAEKLAKFIEELA